MGKTISIKVLFGIYLLLMAGKVFAFSCNVDGGSSIGAGTSGFKRNLWTNRKQGFSRNRPVSHWCHFYL